MQWWADDSAADTGLVDGLNWRGRARQCCSAIDAPQQRWIVARWGAIPRFHKPCFTRPVWKHIKPKRVASNIGIPHIAAAQFVIDWEARRAICPQGNTSAVWVERENRHGHAAIQIRFAKKDCAACVVRARCTTAETQGRAILLRDRDHAAALQEARQRQQTPAWTQAYARRAGMKERSHQACAWAISAARATVGSRKRAYSIA